MTSRKILVPLLILFMICALINSCYGAAHLVYHPDNVLGWLFPYGGCAGFSWAAGLTYNQLRCTV